LVLGFFLGK